MLVERVLPSVRSRSAWRKPGQRKLTVTSVAVSRSVRCSRILNDLLSLAHVARLTILPKLVAVLWLRRPVSIKIRDSKLFCSICGSETRPTVERNCCACVRKASGPCPLGRGHTDVTEITKSARKGVSKRMVALRAEMESCACRLRRAR